MRDLSSFNDWLITGNFNGMGRTSVYVGTRKLAEDEAGPHLSRLFAFLVGIGRERETALTDRLRWGWHIDGRAIYFGDGSSRQLASFLTELSAELRGRPVTMAQRVIFREAGYPQLTQPQEVTDGGD